MFVKPMPHDDYIDAVAIQLGRFGHRAQDRFTTTPDGVQLDGVINLNHSTDPELWPGGVYLGWDQRSGWALCDTGTRTLHPLDLATFAAPQAVAQRAAERLTGAADSDVDEGWDGAEKLAEAVAAWERGSS